MLTLPFPPFPLAFTLVQRNGVSRPYQPKKYRPFFFRKKLFFSWVEIQENVWCSFPSFQSGKYLFRFRVAAKVRKKERIDWGHFPTSFFLFLLSFMGNSRRSKMRILQKGGSIKIGIYNRPSCMLIGTWIRKRKKENFCEIEKTS